MVISTSVTILPIRLIVQGEIVKGTIIRIGNIVTEVDMTISGRVFQLNKSFKEISSTHIQAEDVSGLSS